MRTSPTKRNAMNKAQEKVAREPRNKQRIKTVRGRSAPVKTPRQHNGAVVSPKAKLVLLLIYKVCTGINPKFRCPVWSPKSCRSGSHNDAPRGAPNTYTAHRESMQQLQQFQLLSEMVVRRDRFETVAFFSEKISHLSDRS